jgi:hypothetical protein
MAEYIIQNGELYHYGVKGMKWGVRRNLSVKKAAYKKAKKEYDESFNKAYNKSLAAYSPFKKHRQANDARWKDVADKEDKFRTAKSEYKTAKKEFKADAKAKAATQKAIAKIEKQTRKDFINKRSKEILAGESALARVYDILTDAHKYQAQIEYDSGRRVG